MAPTTEQRTTFRATVLDENGMWIAHCLDLDIVETGPTSEEAVDALVKAVALQLAYAREENNYEYLVKLAPHEAWQKFAELMASDHVTIVRRIDDSKSGVNLVEAQLAA